MLLRCSRIPALKRFEEASAVTKATEPQPGRPPRLVYTLTEVGRELLYDMLPELPADQAADPAEFTARLGQFFLLTSAERSRVLAARTRAVRTDPAHRPGHGAGRLHGPGPGQPRAAADRGRDAAVADRGDPGLPLCLRRLVINPLLQALLKPLAASQLGDASTARSPRCARRAWCLPRSPWPAPWPRWRCPPSATPPWAGANATTARGAAQRRARPARRWPLRAN
jgi:Transcriptional regulator PadR-like family